MDLTLTSSAFAHNEPIPRLYTCQGRDISPPLAWSGVPATAKSLVLIVDDPDAPDPAHPRMTWVHWLLYNLPAGCAAFTRSISSACTLRGQGHGPSASRLGASMVTRTMRGSTGKGVRRRRLS